MCDEIEIRTAFRYHVYTISRVSERLAYIARFLEYPASALIQKTRYIDAAFEWYYENVRLDTGVHE